MIKLYGIPNCDTVKKARTFLESKGLSFDFIDFKKSPPKKTDILRWKEAFGDYPINVKGQTYKKLKAEFEELDEEAKIHFLIKNTSMIKRPVLEANGNILAFGYDENLYSQKLSPLK